MSDETATQDQWNAIWLEYDQITRAKMVSHWKKLDFDSLPRDKSILDVGAGCGQFLQLLREHGFERLLGIEPQETLRRQAPASLTVIDGSCLDLSHLEERYDIVLMFGVLHHLKSFEEMKRAASNIRGVLRDGGCFYSAEPWRNLVRTVVTKLLLETPLGRLHPYFRLESRIWKIERPLFSQWLDLEKPFIRHMTESGFRITLDRKTLRNHYLVYEKA